MKYKRVLTVMGCSCLCLGPLSMASQVFTQTEDIPEIQNKTSGSAEEVPTLSTLPSTEVTESVDSSSASTSSGVADNTTEKPKESKNEEKLPQETPPTQLESVKTANNISPIDKNTKSITSQPATTTVGDWDIQNGRVVAYHGSNTDLDIPAIKDPTTSKICSVDLGSIQFIGSVPKWKITSIRFEAGVNVIGIDCRGFSNLQTFDGTNAIFNVSSLSHMFYNLSKLKSVKGMKITSQVTDMSDMFYWCKDLTSLDVSNFDTSKVTDMSYLFFVTNLNNLDLSTWDTSSVTNMQGMFYSSSNLTSINLGNFNTSNVTNMDSMFRNCGALNLDLSSFNTSKVTNMSFMFEDSEATSIKLSSFDTSNVTNMRRMFNSCGAKSLDLSNFNTSKVTDMSGMFSSCTSLTTLNLSIFNTSNVTNMSRMFSSCFYMTSLNISDFDTAQVTDMSSMFEGDRNLLSLDISKFKTAKVTNMSYLFSGTTGLKNLDTSHLDTSQVTNMKGMFQSTSISSDLSNFNTSKVKDMSLMFNNAKVLNSLNVSGFDTSQVTNMSWMFGSIKGITTLDLSHFDTSKVTDMSGMFASYPLTTLDLSHFDTSNVTTMRNMFYQSDYLTHLDNTGWDTSRVTSMAYMFAFDSKLTNLDLSDFDTSQVTDMNNMFCRTPQLKDLDLTNFSWRTGVNINDIFSEYLIQEKKILVQSASPLDTYDFEEHKIIPFTAVQLNAGEGTFNDGTHTKSIRYASVVNPSIDELEPLETPVRQGYNFEGWSKDTIQMPQVWTAQYKSNRVILPNSDHIGDRNTTNNGLENSKLGIAYQPKYFKGSGKILGLDGHTLFGEKKPGFFSLSVTDDQGGEVADIAHIGVKDTTNQHNSWQLKASFTSTMPTASFVFLDPKLNENKDGNLDILHNNSSGVPPVVLESVTTFLNKQTSIQISSGGETTIMRANTGLQNGVYDFSAKVGLIIQDNSQVAAGDYSGNVHWNLANVPI